MTSVELITGIVSLILFFLILYLLHKADKRAEAERIKTIKDAFKEAVRELKKEYWEL